MEDLYVAFFYEGWWKVLFALAGILVLGGLNRMRLGLMKCPLQKGVAALFWILVVVFYPLMIILFLGSLLASEPLPAVLCLFIVAFLGRRIFGSVIEDAFRGGITAFKNIRRTCRAAEAYNKARIGKTPVAQDLIAAVEREMPENVFVSEDGVIRGTGLPLSLLHTGIGGYLRKNAPETVPGTVTEFAAYGYGKMDPNATRALAALLNRSRRYRVLEHEACRSETVTYDISGSDSSYILSGNRVYGPSDSPAMESYQAGVLEARRYMLTRSDIPEPPKPEAPAKPAQKKW